MKKLILTGCLLPLLLASAVQAGINGVYRVSGTEMRDGKKFTFTGTVTVSDYRNGRYALKFNDGEKVTYTFRFSKKLKDIASRQSVTCSSSLGTGDATFRIVNEKFKVAFTYKARKSFGIDLHGAGIGTKNP